MSEKWTTNNIPNLTDKVFIVTGANSGIGYEAAKEFARKNAQVILACRSMDKANTAVSQIQALIPQAQVEALHLDLASLDSVKQFVTTFKAKYQKLDVLVNNAGIMAVPYGTTEDGFERQMGTNHLGHFALTGLLLDYLLASKASRVVNVSSGAYKMGKMDFDNLQYEDGNGYSPIKAYGRSKLANLLFTYELQRRYQAINSNAISVAAHPGGSKTNLSNGIKKKWYSGALMKVFGAMMQSAAMGALPTIRAAVDPETQGGTYYGPDGFMEQKGYPIIVPSNEASHNEADTQKLWEVSEQLTAVHYEQLASIPEK